MAFPDQAAMLAGNGRGSIVPQRASRQWRTGIGAHERYSQSLSRQPLPIRPARAHQIHQQSCPSRHTVRQLPEQCE